ncbi:MAG TPA: hypothetical protein PLV77_07495, partial [Solirubrobacterales bacterium]|nr:hypothetical protein [Solirubrobacterales bacterium]
MSESSPSPPIRVSIAVALLALSGAWNAGNVGPVASQLAADFDVSLAMVGLVGGTLFFGTGSSFTFDVI